MKFDLNASVALVTGAARGIGAAVALKPARRGFTDALRHDLDNTGIAVSRGHPGGIRTRIAHHARRAMAFDETQAAQLADKFFNDVRTSAGQAADCIVDGIERRASRILVGTDARVLDRLSRLLPIGYWHRIRRVFVVPQSRAATRIALKGENP